MASEALVVTEAVELAPAASVTRTVAVPAEAGAVNSPLGSMVPVPLMTE